MASGIYTRQWFIYSKKILLLLLVLIFLLNSPGAYSGPGLAAEYELGLHIINADQQTQENLYSQYLPVILKSPLPAAPPPTPITFGIYPQSWPGTDGMIEAHAIDAWAGKRSSIIGTFSAIEEPGIDANVRGQLTTIWNNGYTPYVNIGTDYTTNQVANGHLDSYLREWAKALKTFSNGGERMAFLAPFPEMNLVGPYGLDPAGFKAAYWHIQSVFHNEGVPDESLRWVFVPNGWSDPQYNFEYFYPGDATVDVVGFSAYNWGCNPKLPNANKIWTGEYKTFKKYLQRMTAMAPTKPIFISQTGTTAWYCDLKANPPIAPYIDDAKKNDWLFESYAYLATYPGLRAVLYFNMYKASEDFDWPFWISSTSHYDGFKIGVSNSAYGYIPPESMKNVIP